MVNGIHVLQGASFWANSERYTIKHRKIATEKKPELYLARTSPDFRYISSLFPTAEEGVFTFDADAKLYTFILSDASVSIESIMADDEGHK